MDTQQALRFLASHQPMPADTDLTGELVRMYDTARRHFVEVVDERCVRLLVNSFGAGSGFGTYQLVSDALRNQNPERVEREVTLAIGGVVASVQGWAVELAAEFPSRMVLDAVKDAWNGLDSGGRYFGAEVLDVVFDPSEDSAFLSLALAEESDDEVREVLLSIAESPAGSR